MRYKDDKKNRPFEDRKKFCPFSQTNSPVIKKMTTEEYKTQGSDYTAKALAELQQQMQNADIKRSANSSNSPRSKKRRVDDHREYFECDDDDYIDSDDEDEKPKYTDNLLIQNARYRTGIPTSSRTSSVSTNSIPILSANLRPTVDFQLPIMPIKKIFFII